MLHDAHETALLREFDFEKLHCEGFFALFDVSGIRSVIVLVLGRAGICDGMSLARGISGAEGNILKPGKWELVYALPDPSRETKGYALCDAVGKLGVLANGVEEGIECWMGVDVGCGKRLGGEREWALGRWIEVRRIVYSRR
jgi:hypothetical protein